MQTVVAALAAFFTAGLTASAVMPLVIRMAVHRKLLDHPDGARHIHARPVPRIGGVAVFVGLLATLAAAAVVSRVQPGLVPPITPLLPSLAVGCVILFAIGLLDDLHGVRPAMKLLGQSVAALIVVGAGFHIDRVAILPDTVISLGMAGPVIAVLWLVGISNGYNLVDGLDGLAGTVGVVALAGITASAVLLGSEGAPLYSAALAGALTGFLVYNLPPARIFLGDSGSLVVGFLLAVLSVRGATADNGVLHPLLPLIIMSYVVLDTAIAITRRWLRGTPISRADGRHVHHQLRALGLSPRKAILVIGSGSLVITTLGLAATYLPPQMALLVAVLGLAGFLACMVSAVRWLEYHEFLEAGASLASAARTARRVIQDKIVARDVVALVAQADSEEELQEILEEHAPVFRFVHMQLGNPRRILPEPVMHALRGAGLWKVEYPVTTAEAERSIVSGRGAEPLMLTIWCRTAEGRAPANPQRVARILAPALAMRMVLLAEERPPLPLRVAAHANSLADAPDPARGLAPAPELRRTPRMSAPPS